VCALTQRVWEARGIKSVVVVNIKRVVMMVIKKGIVVGKEIRYVLMQSEVSEIFF
jgi:hypothetical protein